MKLQNIRLQIKYSKTKRTSDYSQSNGLFSEWAINLSTYYLKNRHISNSAQNYGKYNSRTHRNVTKQTTAWFVEYLKQNAHLSVVHGNTVIFVIINILVITVRIRHMQGGKIRPHSLSAPPWEACTSLTRKQVKITF